MAIALSHMEFPLTVMSMKVFEWMWQISMLVTQVA